MNLCGGMNVVRQRSPSQNSLKQNITNVTVCEMFHFFMNLTHWKLPKPFSEVYRASSIPFKFLFFTAFLLRIYFMALLSLSLLLLLQDYSYTSNSNHIAKLRDHQVVC